MVVARTGPSSATRPNSMRNAAAVQTTASTTTAAITWPLGHAVGKPPVTATIGRYTMAVVAIATAITPRDGRSDR